MSKWLQCDVMNQLFLKFCIIFQIHGLILEQPRQQLQPHQFPYQELWLPLEDFLCPVTHLEVKHFMKPICVFKLKNVVKLTQFKKHSFKNLNFRIKIWNLVEYVQKQNKILSWIYRTRAIISRSWFEVALVYKPRILSF